MLDIVWQKFSTNHAFRWPVRGCQGNALEDAGEAAPLNHADGRLISRRAEWEGAPATVAEPEKGKVIKALSVVINASLARNEGQTGTAALLLTISRNP